MSVMTAFVRADAPTDRKVRHPSLDGVRGVAVLAVVLFHTDVAWAKGGYLGVDVFFVLSGFLITSLLLTELDRTDRVDLRRFWARRATRLLPALLVLLAVGVVFGPFIAPLESVCDLRDDALATLAQVVNWRFVDTIGHSLVGTARSPFQHCWSLAIEMQFYLLWPPLLMLVAYRRARQQRRRNVGLLAGALALASAAAMLALVGPDWHTQRAYYGTDTRAQALLVGAVLAAIVGHRMAGQHPPVSSITKVGVSVAGTVASAGVLLAFFAAPSSGHVMYEGWYLALAIAVAIVLAQVVLAPASIVPTLLSSRPAVALGRISYSLYLWHWPLLLVLNEGRTGLTGISLFAARVTASLAAACASYFLIERRFR
jgi:peptidoglycan/LPS O-acetylase OafA/YrhL